MKTSNESSTRLLVRMCELLETLATKDGAGQEDDDEAEREMKKDWMLAAAVVDRISAVVITVIFVVGTVTLLVVFAKHP